MAIYLHSFSPPLSVLVQEFFNAETAYPGAQTSRTVAPDQAIPIKPPDWEKGRILIKTDDSTGHTTAEIDFYNFVQHESSRGKEFEGRTPPEREELSGRKNCNEKTPFVVIASEVPDGTIRVHHIVRYEDGNIRTDRSQKAEMFSGKIPSA